MSLDPGDETLAREIHLVESNDGDLYRQQVHPSALNFARKKKAGIFNREKAIKGLANNLVVNAIKRYKKEQRDIGSVSAKTKRRIAELWLPQIEDEADFALREKRPLTIAAEERLKEKRLKGLDEVRRREAQLQVPSNLRVQPFRVGRLTA